MQDIRPHDCMVCQCKIWFCSQSDNSYGCNVHRDIAFEFFIRQLREGAYLEPIVVIPNIDGQKSTDVGTVNGASTVKVRLTAQPDNHGVILIIYDGIDKVEGIWMLLL